MRCLLTILLSLLIASGAVAQKSNAAKLSFDANFQAAFRDFYSGNFDSAYARTLFMIEEALRTNDQRYLAAAYTFSSLYSDHKGRVDEELENLYKALTIYKDLGDSVRISATYRYIGEALGELRMFQNACDLFYRSIKIAGDCDNMYEESRTFNSLYIYTMRELESETDSLAIARQLKNIISKMEFFSQQLAADTLEHLHRQNVTRFYSNLVSAYILKAKNENNLAFADSAQAYIKKVRKIMGFQGVTLMRSFIMESSVMLVKNRYADALARLKEIENLTNTLPLTNSDLASLYRNMSFASKMLGKTDDAIRYKQKSLEYQNLTVNDYNVRVGFEFQAKLMADNEISAHKREQELLEYANNEKLHNVRFITYWVLGILFVLVLALSVLGLVLRRNKKATRKLNILYGKLEKHNRMLVDQQKELASQNTLIQEQRDTVDKINKEIMSSINYAKRIQNAAYCHDEDLRALFPDSFRLIRSVSLVTGHFHFMHVIGNIKILVAATCSRNGVPGSFLSMLCQSALKEVFSLYKRASEFSPSDLLSQTDANLRQIFGNTGTEELSETIDISVVSIDTDNHCINYAGAHQDVYVYNDSEIQKIEGSPYQLGDQRNVSYTTETVKIGKLAKLFAFNNSVAMQVGINDEPFGEQRIREMIAKVAPLPCERQKEEINSILDQWIGGVNQTGDIAIIGINCAIW